jgi:hypothetical protein
MTNYRIAFINRLREHAKKLPDSTEKLEMLDRIEKATTPLCEINSPD